MATAVAGQLYRHCKGDRYRVLTIARDSETREDVVIYYSTSQGGMWARSRTDFEAPHSSGMERFEMVDG